MGTALLAISAGTGCDGGGHAPRLSPLTRPSGFRITYHHSDGTVPPPYHAEWTLDVGADGTAILAYARGYSTTPMTTSFHVGAASLDRLYSRLRQQGLLDHAFKAAAPGEIPVGGGSDTATIHFDGRSVKIPAFARGGGAPLSPVSDDIAKLVPDSAWQAVGRDAVTSSATQPAGRVLVEDAAGRQGAEPSGFAFSVNGDLAAIRLDWRGWGSQTATARTIFVFNPAPHTRSTSIPGTLLLAGLQPCQDASYYTTAQLQFDRPPPFQPRVTRLRTPCG